VGNFYLYYITPPEQQKRPKFPFKYKSNINPQNKIILAKIYVYYSLFHNTAAYLPAEEDSFSYPRPPHQKETVTKRRQTY
jgi:hypothetical protein